MRILQFFSIGILLSLLSFNAKAQEESKHNFSLTGYVDAYYQYNLNKPLSRSNTGRIFDLNHDNISLGLAQTMFTYSNDKSEAVLDLTFGPNAELGNFGNIGTALAIKQAYLAYNISDAVKFTIGQYGTHIGYELIDAPDNFNYSLSYLFGNGPFYHTGAKIDIAATDKLGFMAGIVNGWDALADYNDKKSITLQASLTPSDNLGIYLNWIGGDEYGGGSAFGDIEGSFTSLFDLTTSYTIELDTTGKSLLLGLNAALGSFSSGSEADGVVSANPYDSDATWAGAALYINYHFSENSAIGLRAEYFDDPNGVRYFGPLSVFGMTLTGDFKVADGALSFKPEIRFDKSSDSFFEGKDGGLEDSQMTVGVGFVYNFGHNFK
ncbi:MAG: outer membrane beta-barrel protein [Chitinophagales bacterium]